MATFVWIALLTALSSGVLTHLLAGLARRRGYFLPKIRPRDYHTHPIPRVGGIAVVVSFLSAVTITYFAKPELLQFTDERVWGVDRNLLGLILGVIILSAVNVIDDYRPIPWAPRLLFQIIAALVIAFFGIKIQWLSNPFGPPLALGGFDWAFVVIWLVSVGNVVNWLDGVDGLAGGVAAIAVAVLFYLSLSPTVEQPQNALLAAIVFGAVIGFLPFNFGGRAFLGDTGSVFLGFAIGVMAIISGGKVATAFLVLAIPFLDALVVLFLRLLKGQSPFLPDHRHLAHRLVEIGLKRWQINGIFYGAALLFGLIALNTQTLGKFWALLAALVVMAALISFYSLAQTRKSDHDRTKP